MDPPSPVWLINVIAVILMVARTKEFKTLKFNIQCFMCLHPITSTLMLFWEFFLHEKEVKDYINPKIEKFKKGIKLHYVDKFFKDPYVRFILASIIVITYLIFQPEAEAENNIKALAFLVSMAALFATGRYHLRKDLITSDSSIYEIFNIIIANETELYQIINGEPEEDEIKAKDNSSEPATEQKVESESNQIPKLETLHDDPNLEHSNGKRSAKAESSYSDEKLKHPDEETMDHQKQVSESDNDPIQQVSEPDEDPVNKCSKDQDKRMMKASQEDLSSEETDIEPNINHLFPAKIPFPVPSKKDKRRKSKSFKSKRRKSYEEALRSKSKSSESLNVLAPSSSKVPPDRKLAHDKEIAANVPPDNKPTDSKEVQTSSPSPEHLSVKKNRSIRHHTYKESSQGAWGSIKAIFRKHSSMSGDGELFLIPHGLGNNDLK